MELRLTRPLLRILLVALALMAAVGVFSFLFGDFDGWWEIATLLTCATTAYCSLTGLSCAAAFERKGWRTLPIFGILASAGAFIVLTFVIWAEQLFQAADDFWKPSFILSLLAGGAAHTCALSFARLERRFVWARYVTGAAVLGLVLILSAMLIFEEDDAVYLRTVGALSVLVAMGTLALPIFHRLSGLARRSAPVGPRPEEIELFCPRCHRRQKVFLGDAHCEACELPISIELDWPAEERQGTAAP